jgi:hypothetical protein
MAAEETSEISSSESIEDYSDLWLTKPFKENQFWFMKADDTLEATEVVPDGPEGALTTLGSTFGGDEQAVININNLVIKVRKVDFEEKKCKAIILVKNKAILKEP